MFDRMQIRTVRRPSKVTTMVIDAVNKRGETGFVMQEISSQDWTGYRSSSSSSSRPPAQQSEHTTRLLAPFWRNSTTIVPLLASRTDKFEDARWQSCALFLGGLLSISLRAGR